MSNMPDLAGHISKLEEMHEVAERNIVELTQPTVIFSRIGKLKLPELDDAKTDPLEYHQDNSSMTTVNTQPYPPHSPLEDASVAPAAPPPCPRQRVEAGDITLQER